MSCEVDYGCFPRLREVVLILVLVECLAKTPTAAMDAAMAMGLNPCFGGMSCEAAGCDHQPCLVCLNPCFGGMSCEAHLNTSVVYCLSLNPCFGGMSCEVITTDN